MDQHASIFKDDILRGISLAIKNLQLQDAEVKTHNPKSSHLIIKQDPHFRNLLNYLDLTFSFGLKDSKKGYWPLVKRTAHSSVLDLIEKHRCVNSEIKKGYVWLYLTFIENSLESYVRMVLLEAKALRSYYKNFAILRDEERCEILLNLIAGVEALTFSIDLDDPYLDYGHDPVLREEKVVVRAQTTPSASTNHKQNESEYRKQQPDVTIFNEGKKSTTNYPDLLSEHPKSSKPPTPISEGIETGHDLVRHISRKSKKKKSRPISKIEDNSAHAVENTAKKDQTSPQVTSTTENDNKIGSSNSTTSPRILKTEDPMAKQFSSGDVLYREFLATYDETADNKDDIKEIEKKVFQEEDPRKEHLQNLDLNSARDGNFKYLATAGDNIDKEKADKRQYKYYNEYEEDDYEIYRTDSFDRFCRRGSPEDENGSEEHSDKDSEDGRPRTPDEQGDLAENDLSATPLPVPPQISQETLIRTHSPMTKSISKTSIDKLNDARYDTKAGILLPTLPRRPTLEDATNLTEDTFEIDQNMLVLISLEIFQQPTESPIKVFKVSVGHLAGYGAPFYLLISNVAVYLLKKRATVNAGFINMLAINFDSINKVQSGLNFQEFYIFHDQGCLHLSTGDEVTTRSIIATIKATIKSSQGVSTLGNEPMASNTYNELELVIQDWLICHTQIEEPEILHFSLIYFSSLSSSEKQKRKVVKAGEMSYRHSNFGLITYWEKSFFALRGRYLYQYNAKRTDLKHKYDLSSQCGGCVHSGQEENYHILKIIGSDGSSVILELGIHDNDEADEWLMTICQAVADAKIREGDVIQEPDTLVPCGLVLTQSKIFVFNQDPTSGRLVLEDSCPVYDITQVCMDNQCRTFCALSIDQSLDQSEASSKSMWLFDFESEYELGKFEQRVYGCWQLLYQVPLQFVLLNEPALKKTIHNVLESKGKNRAEIGKEGLFQLISN